MTENKHTSPLPDNSHVEITNLDGSPREETHFKRRQVIRGALGAGLGLTTAAGVFEGTQAVSKLIEEKNQAVKELDEALLREQQSEAKTASQLNAYKQFMCERTVSAYIEILGYPNGHSGELSRLAGFIAHPDNTKAITDAMSNGKYEQRIHAYVRMKGVAKSFVEERYETIRVSKAYDGSLGEAYTGSKESFITIASELLAYASSRGAQPQIGESIQFPLQELVNDEPLMYLDNILALASNTKTAEIFTPTGAKQVDPRQYFLTKLSEVSMTLQDKVAPQALQE